jgi:hypothetical protein
MTSRVGARRTQWIDEIALQSCPLHRAGTNNSMLLIQPEAQVLDLSDQRWGQFSANYTDGSTVANLLEKAYAGDSIDHWFEDLQQEICHQYTISESAYPAAPHLVQLAKMDSDLGRPLLVLLGICRAYSDRSLLDSIPADVKDAWDHSAEAAVPILLELLSEAQPTQSDFLYLVSSLAACSGFSSLARSLESLDYEPEKSE